MKKLFILFVLAFAVLFNAQSQSLKFGLRGGLNNTQLKLNDVVPLITNGGADTTNWEVKAKEGKYGFHFGIFAQVKVLMLFVQPELIFTHGASDISIRDVSSLSSAQATIKKQTMNRLDLPVMVGYKIGPLRLGVGPVASYMISNKSEIAQTIASSGSSIEDKYNKVTWGFQAGVGLNFWKLVVDAKYEGGIGKLSKGVKIDGRDYNFDSRPNMVILSIGYNIL